MSKRFTDTEKWKKAWFRNLPPELKLTWVYLCDNCNHAGIWDVDIGLLQYQLGITLSLDELLIGFQGKVHIFDETKKLWIISFFDFQYGSSSKDFAAKRSAFQLLRSSSLISDQGNPCIRVTEDLPKSTGIGIGISLSIQKGGLGENKRVQNVDKSDIRVDNFDFEALYKKYPRKEGKSQGMKQCQQQIRNQTDYNALSFAIDKYTAHCERNDQIFKHFGSFLGSDRTGFPWREWLEPDAGEGTRAEKPRADLSKIWNEKGDRI